jgi:hypothetical protein
MSSQSGFLKNSVFGENRALSTNEYLSNVPEKIGLQADVQKSSATRQSTGSTYVPMDSWIYPALERLDALGFIQTQSVSIRPWTRHECLRQVMEAQQNLEAAKKTDSASREASRILNDLIPEFGAPLHKSYIKVESIYARYGTIAGPALSDGYHFGQTWWNDYGRPLERGSSAIAGYSFQAVSGRYFLYDRQELQLSPGSLAITPAESQLFNQLDNIPFGSLAPNFFPPQPPTSAYLRQRPLDLYAGVAFRKNSLSFGKQELYWGPTTMGPLAFSSNAEPTYNLRFDSTEPHPFPWVPKLGSYRFDLVFGKLSGHKYPARPYFNGQKIDLILGQYLEVSFTRWSVLWGVGHPVTLRSLKDNIFSANSTGMTAYGSRDDPGDRKSGFDFRAYIPGLRKVVTIYADSYADDDLSPIDAPRRNVWSPGIYFARLPFLPHMDLRVEAVSSEEMSQDEGGTRFFINNQYRDSNQNKGFLLGNAVGRDGRAIEARSTYWFNSRTHIQAGYRQDKISEVFLPHGGTISDGFLNATWTLHREWSINIFSQYERFLIPSYQSGSQHNASGWFQITWNPKLTIGH